MPRLTQAIRQVGKAERILRLAGHPIVTRARQTKEHHWRRFALLKAAVDSLTPRAKALRLPL